MLELFATMALSEKFTEKKEDFQSMDSSSYPWTWIIMTILIALGTSYLAFSCNDKETPATRFVISLFAFLFSGIYLMYYFIVYILLNKKCNGKDVSDMMKMLMK
jgi:uncharacterized protein YybS (DUF2232 family)